MAQGLLSLDLARVFRMLGPWPRVCPWGASYYIGHFVGRPIAEDEMAGRGLVIGWANKGPAGALARTKPASSRVWLGGVKETGRWRGGVAGIAALV